jgi:D-glycero-D-manno-heptose 1,7-bisphosphate phosphatase
VIAARSGLRPAVFLDRDGVIIENRESYVTAWEDVRFIPGALEAVRCVSQTEFAVVVVSNQAAIARGLITLDDAVELNRRVMAVVTAHGGRIDGCYLCPHGPADGCDCRKPASGMLLAAATDLDLDLRASWLIGDAVTDAEAAVRAGCRPVMVRTGRGESQSALMPTHLQTQVPVLPDLVAAVDYVTSETGRTDRQTVVW